MADNIQATPRNYFGGLLSDAYKWMQSPERTQQMQGFAGLLGTTGVPQTIERMAYGEPLTNIGRANVPLLKPETADALMTVAPMVGPAARGAEAGLLSAGRAGERLAERVVPQVMERGGLPAQLLGDLSQGSRSQMYIGAESPMYNKEAAFKASQMLKKGATPQEVWQQTGTAKYGNDFVQEISDAGAKLRDYQFTPKEAVESEIEKALIEGAGSEKYKSMLPYRDMTKNQLLDEYKAGGQKIIDAVQSGDMEKARQLQQDRSGLENMLGAMRSREYGPLSSFMSHGELNKAYPDIYKMHTRINPKEAGGAKGIYRPESEFVKEQMILGERPMWNENKSTMLHEAQHAVQQREGWAKGGSADQFARELIRERKALESKVTDLNEQMRGAVGTPAYEDLMNQRIEVVNELLGKKLDDPVDLLEQAQKQYEALAGEAMARSTQTRMNLSPEERLQYYPFEQQSSVNPYGLDVNPNELVFRGGLLDEAKSASTLPSDYYELNTMATQAYTDLRAKPSQEAADYYKSIMKARDEAANNPSNNYTPPAPDVVTEGYKGQHQAPTKDGGAPLWNLKDTYPDDFYSSQGARFYGDGADEARDRMIVSQMQSMKGRPDKPVTIYRAVPKSVPTKEALNTGDWITLDRQYAKEHGEGALNGDYKIIKKTVKARDLFTNGDSIYEMGYDPQPYIPKSNRGLLD